MQTMSLVYLLLVTHVLSSRCVDSGSSTGWGDICSTKITKEICDANSVVLDGVYYDNIDYYCCATCEKFSCKPYTEETCKKVAARLGLTLGGGGYSFAASDYGAKGCYTYNSGSYKGHVFYGRGGSTAQQRTTSLWGGRVRPAGWDCASTSEESALGSVPDGQGQWLAGYSGSDEFYGGVWCGAKYCGHFRDCKSAADRLNRDKDLHDLSGCPSGFVTHIPNDCEKKNFWGTKQYLRKCHKADAETAEFVAMSKINESVGVSKVVQALALVGFLASVYGAGCYYLKA